MSMPVVVVINIIISINNLHQRVMGGRGVKSYQGNAKIGAATFIKVIP